MKVENTSTRLKQIMSDRNLRQIDIINLAKPYCEKYKIKLNKSDLSQFVNGKTEPGQSKLTILGLALNVSETWLLGYDVPMERESPTLPPDRAAAPKPSTNHNPFTLREHENRGTLFLRDSGTQHSPPKCIPILGTISAGQPLYAKQHIEGYTYTELNHGGEYFGLRIKDDSMTAAQIQPGSIVTVKRQPTVENGEIAVVLVGDEEATVKRYHRDEDGPIVTLTPQSYNPKHQPQIYDLCKTKLIILGKVVRVQIDF